MPFLVRHSGATINRENIGADGMTPYKRLKGKEFKKEILKIGECVWFLKPQSKGKNKAESRWLNGIWLGVRRIMRIHCGNVRRSIQSEDCEKKRIRRRQMELGRIRRI